MRSEAVADSNEAAKMQFKLANINNKTGGCIGMCGEPTIYRLEIQKQVVGTQQFVTVWTYHQKLKTETVNIPEFYLPTVTVCNADYNTKIRFALIFDFENC